MRLSRRSTGAEGLKDSAPQRQEAAGPVVDLRDELDGYTVSFTALGRSHRREAFT
jgi:hypothetical protein